MITYMCCLTCEPDPKQKQALPSIAPASNINKQQYPAIPNQSNPLTFLQLGPDLIPTVLQPPTLSVHPQAGSGSALPHKTCEAFALATTNRKRTGGQTRLIERLRHAIDVTERNDHPSDEWNGLH